MFYNSRVRRIIRRALFAALFVLGTAAIFPQNDDYIPEELLRPRRDEAPRYPIDTVIGTLGQGRVSPDAYGFARRIAAALLAGDIDSSVLSSINRRLLENYMDKLQEINPRYFRLGSGREEPDGAVSFLIRFAGREQGITGELFIRFAELRRPTPPSPPVTETAADSKPEEPESADTESVDIKPVDTESPGIKSADIKPEDIADSTIDPEADASAGQETAAAPPTPPPPEKVWVFEDLILEAPRSRETENAESRHRFDFPPYERFF